MAGTPGGAATPTEGRSSHHGEDHGHDPCLALSGMRWWGLEQPPQPPVRGVQGLRHRLNPREVIRVSAKYTMRDKARTAITATFIGVSAGACYALPLTVTMPALCLALYWLGVMDGRAKRRGGRAIEVARQVRMRAATLVQRPAGGKP